jgi:hypothetical protein
MTSAVLRGLSSIVLISASTAILAAQHHDGAAVFHGGVDLVVMDVAVADAHHDSVANLTASDFNVYEDGAQQPLSFFASQRVPIDTALVFDTSASMTGELDAVQQCGTSYAESITGGDRATVIDLKERVNILQPLTSSPAAVTAAMMQGKALARQLARQEIAAAHRAMDTLATETGGRVLVEDRDDLRLLCSTVARELAARYTLGYVSAHTKRDGRYRRITVRVAGRPDLTTRTRAGYLDY